MRKIVAILLLQVLTMIIGFYLIYNTMYDIDNNRLISLAGLMLIAINTFTIHKTISKIIQINDTKTEKTKDVVYYITPILIILVVLTFVAFFKYDKYMLNERGVVKEVVINEKYWLSLGKRASGNYIFFNFATDDGQIIYNREMNDDYNVGDTLFIKYDRRRPKNNIIISKK